MESASCDLWFDDGNLVIQTGLALFRVHKSVLAIHATVFRDMVSFPSPASQDTYEGIQLAVFQDDAQDMRHFLRALYFPEYVVFIASASLPLTLLNQLLSPTSR